MTKLDLDALEAIHAKATPEEWYIVPSYASNGDLICEQIVAGKGRAAKTVSEDINRVEDQKAIISAHNNLPALIARVRELEGAVKEYRLGEIQTGKQWNGLQDLVVTLDLADFKFEDFEEQEPQP